MSENHPVTITTLPSPTSVNPTFPPTPFPPHPPTTTNTQIDVNGAKADPLYKFLKETAPNGLGMKGEIAWNFCEYVSQDGMDSGCCLGGRNPPKYVQDSTLISTPPTSPQTTIQNRQVPVRGRRPHQALRAPAEPHVHGEGHSQGARP